MDAAILSDLISLGGRIIGQSLIEKHIKINLSDRKLNWEIYKYKIDFKLKYTEKLIIRLQVDLVLDLVREHSMKNENCFHIFS